MMIMQQTYGWTVAWILIVLLVGIIVGLSIWVIIVRFSRKQGPGFTEPGEEDAIEILKKRFARGEIDQAEFEEKKRLLHGK